MLETLAERYLRLGFELGRHIDGIVDGQHAERCEERRPSRQRSRTHSTLDRRTKVGRFVVGDRRDPHPFGGIGERVRGGEVVDT